MRKNKLLKAFLLAGKCIKKSQHYQRFEKNKPNVKRENYLLQTKIPTKSLSKDVVHPPLFNATLKMHLDNENVHAMEWE